MVYVSFYMEENICYIRKRYCLSLLWNMGPFWRERHFCLYTLLIENPLHFKITVKHSYEYSWDINSIIRETSFA